MPTVTKKDQKGIRQHGALVCVVAEDDLEKTEAIPISFMTWKSKASKRTVLSAFGAAASASRVALDLAEYTRVLPDECGEEHLPIRVITDCKSLFDCFGQKGVRQEWEVTQNDRDSCADTSTVGRRTDEIICRSLLEKRSDFWNRSAPRGEYESLDEEINYQQSDKGSGRLSGPRDLS